MKKETNCPLCGGKAVLKMEDLKLPQKAYSVGQSAGFLRIANCQTTVQKLKQFAINEGNFILRDSPYYTCLTCHEEFIPSEQMHELSEQLRSRKFTVRIKG